MIFCMSKTRWWINFAIWLTDEWPYLKFRGATRDFGWITLPVLHLWELFFAYTKTSIFGIVQVLAQAQAIIACASSQKAQGHNQIGWRWNSKWNWRGRQMSKRTGIFTETHNTFTNFTSHRQKVKGMST